MDREGKNCNILGLRNKLAGFLVNNYFLAEKDLKVKMKNFLVLIKSDSKKETGLKN